MAGNKHLNAKEGYTIKSEMEVPGTSKAYVQELLTQDGLQVMKVLVEKGGEIPMHRHDCAATMVVVAGKAKSLGTHGRMVQKGDIIVKKPNEPHGFAEVTEPFTFISISDEKGIMQKGHWDINYL